MNGYVPDNSLACQGSQIREPFVTIDEIDEDDDSSSDREVSLPASKFVSDKA